MKRFRQWLFNLATGVSAVALLYLILGAVQGWTSSSATNAQGITVQRRGLIHFGDDWDGGPVVERIAFLGFQHIRFHRLDQSREGSLTDLPYWPFIAAVAFLPGVWGYWCWRRIRIAKWVKAGRCPNCGYDLRATPERCPECGAIPEAMKA